MTFLTRLAGLLGRLPPAETYDLGVERDLPVPMPDGVTLLADHYYPRQDPRAPLILVRSPYGRAGLFGLLFARLFAERGFQVCIQSCRGTFGSGGTFDAFRDERADGLATVAWLRAQLWYPGGFATLGPSYLGLTQWAIAAEAGADLQAMVPQITASEFRSLTYSGESFGLDTGLTWIAQLAHQEEPWRQRVRSLRHSPARQRAAVLTLPLERTDLIAAGRPVAFYRDWLAHNAPNDPWWAPVDFSGTVGAITAPILLLGGWYDIFLPHTLEDYARLRAAGRRPYLTIGPWAHASPGLFPVALRESLAWFRVHLRDDRTALRRAPVRVYIMGANRWRGLPDWPPAGTTTQRWHLQPGYGLAPNPPPDGPPDHYRYDPADPTPAVGGSSLSTNSGPRDNRKLEARPDVLVYTSAPLEQDLEAIGPVEADLYVTSSREHTDFAVRLCDVDARGRSINVCDGLLRLEPGRPAPASDGARRVTIALWPTAYRFRRGHRLRVQVASGAHPRWARNPGSGEPLATATHLLPADQTIHHDPAHPSALLLPVGRR